MKQQYVLTNIHSITHADSC